MKLAAMAAKLVGMKNVSTYGSVELRLHMPQEHALQVTQLFGWPTVENPISVAIARLEEGEIGDPACKPDCRPLEPDPAEYVKRQMPGLQQASPHMQEKARYWSDMSPAQQSGVIRREPAFWDFANVANAEQARDYIRNWCSVNSCAEIKSGFASGGRWAELMVAYGHYLRQHPMASRTPLRSDD